MACVPRPPLPPLSVPVVGPTPSSNPPGSSNASSVPPPVIPKPPPPSPDISHGPGPIPVPPSEPLDPVAPAAPAPPPAPVAPTRTSTRTKKQPDWYGSWAKTLVLDLALMLRAVHGHAVRLGINN
ncbi:hypothetical protein PCASD_02216 [Puccinia coronata f. sp. avenae]|uniref:Uncharacterized protein n=1 Tax=Puccinia coronata f. sp. avenae TaxID=200324 RepID=A0A2N5VHU7_9BASI|nr:hypothetical protein PCASD_02216 [Puccinia coronata f. sp. avenae]